ncbi:MAG: hypothetical protein GY804_04090 [Alphaproteobacteria bacterium]|nr:hypothetical protein [Alphaproteobacteria bacterium]
MRINISRREPLITLKPIRILGRNYKEGAYFDRRRVRYSLAKTLRLIKKGVIKLAREMDPEDLKKYGFIYDERAPRLKLVKIEETLNSSNQKAINKMVVEEATKNIVDEITEEDRSPEPTLKHRSNGWYDVMVDGEKLNDSPMRKSEALELISEYKGE